MTVLPVAVALCAASQASGLQLFGYQQGCSALRTFEGDDGFGSDEANATQVFGFGGLTG